MSRKKRKEDIVINRYSPSVEDGLTDAQVAERVAQGLDNHSKSKASRSYPEIIAKNVFTFFNILCFIVAAVLMSFGLFSQCFFILIILANTLIGIIQEVRSKRMVEKLTLISSPTAEVVRGGKVQSISVDKIVLDDICLYEAGKQVSADGVLKSGWLYVNESLLTGESVDVKKQEGDKLFAGSFVTGGRGAAAVEHVGKDNYVSALATRAKKLKSNQSPILKTLNRIIKGISFAIIPLTVFVALKCYLAPGSAAYHNVLKTVERTAGAMIGMIPSGMFLLTSVALAVGVIKLALNKTLVQDLYCIEMLARCNVLCLDKTGTLTDGTMKVSKAELIGDGDADIGKIVSSLLAATNDNNSTAQALIAEFGNTAYYSATANLPFSSATKFSAATFDGNKTYVMGAAEFVLKSIPTSIMDKILEYSMNGMRVLLVAEGDGAIANDEVPSGLVPTALIAIEDHIREEAVPTIEWFKQNNVAIKIISGDNPVTVSHIARRVGVENADKFISLDGMTDEEVSAVAGEYTVFGRVTPDQKALLVSAMKRNGETVAMTGDGVNDILAFKEADCSVAMAAGSEAARNVASLVLMDSNFANMPKVVAEGRRVVNNIQQSASVYLMKTIFVALTILITLGTYPFKTIHLMILEFFVIGLPTFFLALQPNDKLIKGNFLLMLLKRAVPSAVVLALNFSAMMIVGKVANLQPDTVLTMQLITVSFAGLIMLGIICYPYNLFRAVLVSVMSVLSILAIVLLPAFFGIVQLELWQLLAVLLAISLSLPIGVILHYAAGKIRFRKFE